MQPIYLAVEAEPRYWEDTTVNGVVDEDGILIPCRDGAFWKPIIELSSGKIINWELGKSANIHYKVCDQGEYFLLDANQKKIKKYNGYYVPDEVLCVDDEGYGDYIIMSVDMDGVIKNYKPIIEENKWLDVVQTRR